MGKSKLIFIESFVPFFFFYFFIHFFPPQSIVFMGGNEKSQKKKKDLPKSISSIRLNDKSK